jgi:hypothetical protein
VTVVSLHRAPTCSVCHELPAEYLMHTAPTPPADPAERAPVHALPASVMLVCASCSSPYREWPALPAGVQLCRLGAGILAALAGSQPRCSVVTCSAAVSKWGRRCGPCGDRGEAAVAAELEAAAAKRRTAKALRRRARSASKRAANGAPKVTP